MKQNQEKQKKEKEEGNAFIKEMPKIISEEEERQIDLKKKIELQQRWREAWDTEIHMKSLRNVLEYHKKPIPMTQYGTPMDEMAKNQTANKTMSHANSRKFRDPKSQPNGKNTFVTCESEDGGEQGIKGIKMLRRQRSSVGSQRVIRINQY